MVHANPHELRALGYDHAKSPIAFEPARELQIFNELAAQRIVTAERIVGDSRDEEILPVRKRPVGTLRIVDLAEQPAGENDHLQDRGQNRRFRERPQLLARHNREGVGTVRARKRDGRDRRVRSVPAVGVGEKQPLTSRDRAP